MAPFDPRSVPAGLEFRPWQAPDGWRHRAYRWASDDARPRGSLLFESGRADFAEKHFEAFAEWHAAGWNVAGFDWRGQGGSGRLLADPDVGHLASIDPLVADLAAFAAVWRAEEPGPHVIVAHSMGAHVALRLLSTRPESFDAAVLVSPMLALNSAPLPGWLARAAIGAMRLLRRGERSAWRQDRGRAAETYRRRALTGSVERHADAAWWQQANPELRLGPPSWAWLAAANASQRLLEAPGALEHIATPILILGSERDRLVRFDAMARAAARLPHAQLLRFDGAHELLREAEPVRGAVMAAIDAFLARAAPPPAAA